MKSCRVNYIIMFAFAMFFTPAIAWANVGTTFFDLKAMHLLYGNLLLGVFEGVLLNFINKVYRRRLVLIGWMILANYVSAGIGFFIVEWVKSSNFLTINNFKFALIGLYIGAWLITILIEWPFVYIALKRAQMPFVTMKKSLKSSIIIQTISYVIILPIYLNMSSANLAFQTTPDPSLSFVKNVNAVIYYISPDYELCRINIDGTGNEKVLASRINFTRRLRFMKSDNNFLDLYDNKDSDKPILIASNIQRITNKSRYPNLKDIDYKSSDLRDDNEKKQNQFRCDLGGVAIDDKFNGMTRSYSVITPFAIWIPSNLGLLPKNIAVFELYNTSLDPRTNQIVVWDYNNKKIGLLTKGSSPVVIYN